MDRKVIRVEPKIPQREKALRVAAYCRVSSDKDAMLHSLSAQVSYFSECIQKHNGWIFCGVYYDEAKTGTKDNRQGFMALLEKCKKGEIDMILTKSVSRFSRNALTLLATVRELKALGVSVQFDEENINTLTEDGEFMLSLIASVAQEESRSASDNQKWRIQKCYERGEDVNTNQMFGYDISKHRFIPNEEEANVVNEIFTRIENGESYSSIARDLNRRGIKGKRGGKWAHHKISRLVANERLMGDCLLQKTFISDHLEKRHTVNHGERPMYYAEGTHEGIVPKALYMEVQEIRASRKQLFCSTAKPQQYPFTGIIRCENCGKNYRRVVWKNKVYWNCPTYINEGKDACPSKKIPQDILEAICAEVLDIDSFDSAIFLDRIDYLSIPYNGCIRFFMKGGAAKDMQWSNKPRSESWTPEMKEAARARTQSRNRGNQKWQEQ